MMLRYKFLTEEESIFQMFPQQVDPNVSQKTPKLDSYNGTRDPDDYIE